jgi:hypothetical protein
MVNHMPFCTSCGEELSPGTKFCESCGAPVEQQRAAAATEIPVTAPSQPLAQPQKEFLTTPVLICIILVLAVIAAGVWFVDLPFLKGNSAVSKDIPAPTTIPIPTSITPVIREITPDLLTTPTTPVKKLEGRYEAYYEEIYTLNQFFAFGQKETFPYDVTTPPLYIKYSLTPQEITREKIVEIGTSLERTISVTYPNPNAWFEIRVLDANNGAVIEDRGYGKDFPDETKGEFMVRNAGNYQIEFSGNDVTAEIRVLKGTS